MIRINNVIILSYILFGIGLFGFIIRNNLLFKLISVEIINNSILLLAITASNKWHSVDGCMIYILVITTSAVKIGIGLLALLKLQKINKKPYLE